MSPPLLEIDRLGKRFGGLRAVDQVSFGVEADSITAIIGPNGAGKTTLFNLVSGFLVPHEGRVILDGEEMTHFPAHRIAARGLVRSFQLVRLFPAMSVLANVLVGFHLKSRGGFWSAALRPPWVRRQETAILEQGRKLLALVGLEPMADAAVASLSYGQQRLLEIARAAAAGPRLMLLDEPAAGLNPEETQKLARIIGTLRGLGITVLLIEHDMTLVMGIADKIVVLDFGRKIAEGTPDAVQRDPAVIEAYLGSV